MAMRELPTRKFSFVFQFSFIQYNSWRMAKDFQAVIGLWGKEGSLWVAGSKGILWRGILHRKLFGSDTKLWKVASIDQPSGYSDSRKMLDDMDIFGGILPFHNDLLFFENCLPNPQGLSAIVVLCAVSFWPQLITGDKLLPRAGPIIFCPLRSLDWDSRTPLSLSLSLWARIINCKLRNCGVPILNNESGEWCSV